MTTESNPLVELDELLASEYDYISQTAMQAYEDRSRVSSFYLIAVGSLVAALLSTQLIDPNKLEQTIKLMFSGLFLILTMLGMSTVMQLARLRSAWYESALAMNQIKDFAVKQNPELANAFRWRTDTIPSKYKKNSISYYQALEVSLIGGLMAGSTVFFFLQAFFPPSVLNWILCLILGGAHVFMEMAVYKRLLK